MVIVFFFLFSREKYVKNCQIRHTYGEEEEDAGISAEEATVIAENAISEGSDCRTVPDMSAQDITAAPANSIVTGELERAPSRQHTFPTRSL